MRLPCISIRSKCIFPSKRMEHNGSQARNATLQWEFHWLGHIYGLNLIEQHLNRMHSVFIKRCAETNSMPFNRLANQKMIIQSLHLLYWQFIVCLVVFNQFQHFKIELLAHFTQKSVLCTQQAISKHKIHTLRV